MQRNLRWLGVLALQGMAGRVAFGGAAVIFVGHSAVKEGVALYLNVTIRMVYFVYAWYI